MMVKSKVEKTNVQRLAFLIHSRQVPYESSHGAYISIYPWICWKSTAWVAERYRQTKLGLVAMVAVAVAYNSKMPKFGTLTTIS